jgi:hypothetical protein
MSTLLDRRLNTAMIQRGTTPLETVIVPLETVVCSRVFMSVSIS